MKRVVWWMFWGSIMGAAGEPLLRQGAALTPEQGADALTVRIKETPDLKMWKIRAGLLRRGIGEGLGLSLEGRREAPVVMKHSMRRHSGYTVENVGIEFLDGWWVGGNLYMPDPRPASFPVVLMPHGHLSSKPAGGDGRFHPDVQLRGGSLARCGAAALSLDMLGYGDSRLQGWNHKAGPWVMRAQIWAAVRSLDWLLSLQGADSARAGVTGESGGGTQTLLLAAIDERVSAAVPCVMVSSWFFGGCDCESGLPIHVRPGYQTNLAEIAALTAPRPQLVISCGADWTRNVPKSEFPFLQHVYSLYGVASHVENAHFAEEMHDFGPRKREAMRRFFGSRFGIPARGDAEQEVVVEAFETMRAFDADHPLPRKAVLPGAVFPVLGRGTDNP